MKPPTGNGRPLTWAFLLIAGFVAGLAANYDWQSSLDRRDFDPAENWSADVSGDAQTRLNPQIDPSSAFNHPEESGFASAAMGASLPPSRAPNGPVANL